MMLLLLLLPLLLLSLVLSLFLLLLLLFRFSVYCCCCCYSCSSGRSRRRFSGRNVHFVHVLCVHCCCCATVVVVVAATANCLVAFKSNYETRTHAYPAHPVLQPTVHPAHSVLQQQQQKRSHAKRRQAGVREGNWGNTPKGICACILINID